MPRIAKWKQLSEEDFAQLVKESRSFQDLAQRIGYEKTGGGTQEALKKVVKERELDTSHFTGQGWNKGQHDYSTFVNGFNKHNGKNTLKAIIALRGRKCECCGLTEWLGQPITLEIHHIDGIHNNNELSNIQLLCPNCHSYTDTYHGKNINSGKIKVSDEELVEALQKSSSIRQALMSVQLAGSGGNYKRANELIIKYQITKFLK